MTNRASRRPYAIMFNNIDISRIIILTVIFNKNQLENDVFENKKIFFDEFSISND